MARRPIPPPPAKHQAIGTVERQTIVSFVGGILTGRETRDVVRREVWILTGVGFPKGLGRRSRQRGVVYPECGHVVLSVKTRARVSIPCPDCLPPVKASEGGPC